MEHKIDLCEMTRRQLRGWLGACTTLYWYCECNCGWKSEIFKEDRRSAEIQGQRHYRDIEEADINNDAFCRGVLR